MSFMGGTLAYIWGLYNSAVASLASMTADRDTWQGRANNAWGATRVWNSGTSFETAYNSEVTLYNAEVSAHAADLSLWQGRANNAWGSSRVWNSGTSFETTIANMADTLTTTAINLSQNADVGNNDASSGTATLTIPKTGHYHIAIYAVGLNTMTCGSSDPRTRVNVGGTAGVSDATEIYKSANTPTGGMTAAYGYSTHGTYSAGQTVTFSFTTHDMRGSMVGNIHAHWVPTASNPS